MEEMLGSNALDFVIDNYHYDSILYNKELYCEENILLAVPKHFAVNEELGMYQLSYKNIKNKNYLNQKYPSVPLGRFADLPFIMLTQGNDTRTRGDRLCRNVGFKPNIVLEFNQQSTAYMASSTQLGATFISDILVSQLPTFENLVYYKLDGEEAKRKVFFYYKTHKYKTRVMEEFVRMMHPLLERMTQDEQICSLALTFQRIVKKLCYNHNIYIRINRLSESKFPAR